MFTCIVILLWIKTIVYNMSILANWNQWLSTWIIKNFARLISSDLVIRCNRIQEQKDLIKIQNSIETSKLKLHANQIWILFLSKLCWNKTLCDHYWTTKDIFETHYNYCNLYIGKHMSPSKKPKITRKGSTTEEKDMPYVDLPELQDVSCLNQRDLECTQSMGNCGTPAMNRSWC